MINKAKFCWNWSLEYPVTVMLKKKKFKLKSRFYLLN